MRFRFSIYQINNCSIVRYQIKNIPSSEFIEFQCCDSYSIIVINIQRHSRIHQWHPLVLLFIDLNQRKKLSIVTDLHIQNISVVFTSLVLL